MKGGCLDVFVCVVVVLRFVFHVTLVIFPSLFTLLSPGSRPILQCFIVMEKYSTYPSVNQISRDIGASKRCQPVEKSCVAFRI
jgi:hypothetical protein